MAATCWTKQARQHAKVKMFTPASVINNDRISELNSLWRAVDAFTRSHHKR